MGRMAEIDYLVKTYNLHDPTEEEMGLFDEATEAVNHDDVIAVGNQVYQRHPAYFNVWVASNGTEVTPLHVAAVLRTSHDPDNRVYSGALGYIYE